MPMRETEASACTADPILRKHDSSVRGVMLHIGTMCSELPGYIAELDCTIDALPDAVAAVRASLLDEAAIASLHRLTAEVMTRANAVHTRTTVMRQIGTHGRTQLEKYRTRLADVERLNAEECPPDEATVTGDLAEEMHDAG